MFDAVQDVGQFVVDATMDFGRRLAAPLASWSYEEMEGGVSGFGRQVASWIRCGNRCRMLLAAAWHWSIRLGMREGLASLKVQSWDSLYVSG